MLLVIASETRADQPLDVMPLFRSYCFDCHGGGADEGHLALDKLLELDDSDASEQTREWKHVWKIVRHEFMPPSGSERPSADERNRMTQWIETNKLGVNREQPDPGRVTIRRLNRVEYEYTITDLFGVTSDDLDATQTDSSGDSLGEQTRLALRDRLPPDDTAYGFDNIGDFLSMSPALLETFFDIAESIVPKIVSLDGPRTPELELSGGAFHRQALGNSVEHVVDFNVQHAGEYEVKVNFTTGGWQDFGGAFQLSISVDDSHVSMDEITVGGNHMHRYSPRVKFAPGDHRVRITTVPIPSTTGELPKPLELTPKGLVVGPYDAGIVEYPMSHQQIFFDGDPPADRDARQQYARAIVQRVADRAFRRPADSATLDRLVEIVMSSPSFERGVGDALIAILASPKFLFRAELQPRPNDPESVHSVDDYALASRLSYLLWLSLPDEELTQLAAAGELRDRLRDQVQRMLADPKSARFFEDFPGQWLRTRNVLLTSISRSAGELYPVRNSMKRETELLFEYIAREDRDLVELVTADYTFVDKALAAFYELPSIQGDGFQKVSLLPESHRGGILTHGSFLVATSNPNRTSPVKRGLFALENLLGIEPPPPPPDIPPLDVDDEDGESLTTVSAQLARHRADSSCAACHDHFDPIGVTLENYDLIGRWRDNENGQAISPNEKTITGETLTGIHDLKQVFLNQKPKYYRGVTEKLMTYALGRGLEPSDAVTVDAIAEQLVADGGKFSTLLLGIIESPAFQYRRGDDGHTVTGDRSNLPKMPSVEVRQRQRRALVPVVQLVPAIELESNEIESDKIKDNDVGESSTQASSPSTDAE